MYTQRDYAFKIGCGRLIFEDHALQYLPEELKKLGKRPYLVTGAHAWAADGEQITELLQKAGIDFVPDIYTGACCEEKAREITDACRKQGCDVIVGVGGGRIMDLAKTTANLAGLPVMNVPTIAATCAAYTPLSVIYTPEGASPTTWYFKREIDCVLCDVTVLSREPGRYFAAGIMDAMAKWVEISHYNDRLPGACQDELLARSLAEGLYGDLKRDGLKAVQGDTKVIRNVLFHNIVTTGMISGIARGLYQSALAHGLYYAIRTLHRQNSAPYLHGEVVAVGMLFQADYLDNDSQKAELRQLMREMHMPLSLSEIHVQCDDESLRQLADYPSVAELYHADGKKQKEALELLKSIR